jgi:hypothetical protein
MEQQLDATYLRPSFVSKALALSVLALGIGAAILLAAFGLSFVWRTVPTNLDVRIANPEVVLKQVAPLIVAPIKLEEDHRATAVLPSAKLTQSLPADVIQQEVIVFLSVSHGAGSVVTGWKFPNGNGGVPSGQFCYYDILNADHSRMRVDIAFDGKPKNDDVIDKVPEVGVALSKCKWWKA